jgi:holo-[acyl-carrier protein] synthase
MDSVHMELPSNSLLGAGNVVAHGVDLVDIEDMRRLVETPLSSQLHRTFTQGELHASGEGRLRLERLAGRLATKEAVMKALGLGFGDGVGFLDIETVNLDSGAPTIVLHNRVAEIATQVGVDRWLVSTSHTDKVAFASVIGVTAA